MFGPGKFLRGREGIKSANEAVNVLEEKSEITIQYFLSGFCCIIISSILKSFILHTFMNALIVSIGLLIMSYYLVNIGMRIKNELYVDTNKAISGQIRTDQIIDPTNTQLM